MLADQLALGSSLDLAANMVGAVLVPLIGFLDAIIYIWDDKWNQSLKAACCNRNEDIWREYTPISGTAPRRLGSFEDEFDETTASDIQ